MSKKALIGRYKEDLKSLKTRASAEGLREKEFQTILKQSYRKLQSSEETSKVHFRTVSVAVLVLITFTVLLYLLLNFHTPTSSIVLRNVQGLTYPALKVVRSLSVPIITLFPSLTNWYDESCLIKNPHFYLADLDCSPCENVHSVIDLTGIEGVNPYEKVSEGTPLVMKTNQLPVDWHRLKELYQNYSQTLGQEIGQLSVSNAPLNSFSSNEDLPSNAHIQWRIKKMSAARMIRKLFPKPAFFPERSGQHLERFIYIDGTFAEPYTLPNTECNYVFVIQGSGERTIALRPTKECQMRCKTVSVTLKPSHVLLYDWWYWRPVSLPGNINSNLSISYVNSYC